VRPFSCQVFPPETVDRVNKRALTVGLACVRTLLVSCASVAFSGVHAALSVKKLYRATFFVLWRRGALFPSAATIGSLMETREFLSHPCTLVQYLGWREPLVWAFRRTEEGSAPSSTRQSNWQGDRRRGKLSCKKSFTRSCSSIQEPRKLIFFSF